MAACSQSSPDDPLGELGPRPTSACLHGGAGLIAIVFLLSLMTTASSARSQSAQSRSAAGTRPISSAAPSAEAAVIAEALFREAMTLMDAKKFANACPKLEESQRLAPGLGTRFHLGDCYEKLGRRMSAWYTFADLAEVARGAGHLEGARKARARADALLPLPKLTIVVSTIADTAGLEIKRDGVALGRPAWGTAIPVDPGVHEVSASAPGKEPWTSTVNVAAPSASIEVRVPPLSDASIMGLGRRGASLVVGATGAASLVAGGIFGAMALSRAGDARAQCAASDSGNAGSSTCKPTSVAMTNGTYTFADLSTGFFIGGAATLAGAVVLWLTSPPRESGASVSLRLVPFANASRAVGIEGAGGLVEGTF